MLVKLITRNGTVLEDELQGSGGTIKTLKDIPRLMKSRIREEESDPLRGEHILPIHRGNVSVWTDPDNEDCRSRLSTTKASQVKQITVADEVLWNSLTPIGG